MRYIPIIIAFIQVLFSCDTRHHKIIKKSIYYDSIIISNDFPYINKYTDFRTATIENQHILIGYNRHVHAIDSINISLRTSLSSNSLSYEGVNGITSNISSLISIPTGIVLLENSFELVFLDHENNILKKSSGSDITDPETGFIYMISPMGIVNLKNYRIYLDYDSKRESLLMATYPLVSTNNALFYDYHIGVELDIVNNEFNFIPLLYKDILEEGEAEYFGDLIYPNIKVAGDLLVINSPYSSVVHTYDRKSKVLRHYNPKSQLTENTAKPLLISSGILEDVNDISKKILYEFNSLQFREVYYADQLKYYFRVHYGENTQDLGNPKRDKFLMIMNNKMEPVSELRLPDHFTDQYFVCEDVIYFYLQNQTDDIHLGAVNIGENI